MDRSARKIYAQRKATRQEQLFLIQEFDNVAKMTVLRQKPPLENCSKRIVRFNFFGASASTNNVPLARGREGLYWGRVAEVNAVLRILRVLFFDPQIPVLFPQDIPYDHPDIQWFALPGDDDFILEAVLDMVEEEIVVPVDTSEEDLQHKNAVNLQKFVRGR